MRVCPRLRSAFVRSPLLAAFCVVTSLSLLPACHARDENLFVGISQLGLLSERAVAHRARLDELHRRRDDLGPGDYRVSLERAHDDLVRALELETESRTAALLAQLAETLDAAGDRGRRLVASRLSPSLSPLAVLPAISLARAALEHGSRTAAAALAYRARAAEAATALVDLRARVLGARKNLASARLAIAESLAALGPPGTAHAAELVPLATRHKVKVILVKALQAGGDSRMTRASLAVKLEAASARPLAAFVGALAERAGVSIHSIETARNGGATVATIELILRRLRSGATPLPAQSATSTLAALDAELGAASAWREALAEAIIPEPGAAFPFVLVVRALPPGARLERFAATNDRFAVLARLSGAGQGFFLKQINADRRVEDLRPATQRGKVALRGRYRANVAPIAVASTIDAIAPPRAPPPRWPVADPGARRTPSEPPLLKVTPPTTAEGEPGFRLVGIASAGAGEVRALLRDGAGRPHIVKVGSRLDDGSKILKIGSGLVTALRRGETIEIRSAD